MVGNTESKTKDSVLGDRMARGFSDQVPKADKGEGENQARTWEKCVPGRGRGAKGSPVCGTEKGRSPHNRAGVGQ